MEKLDDHAQSIFLNALELESPAAREAYLEAQCGTDPELRKEVEDLLEHASRAGKFLDGGVGETIDLAITEKAGDLIGPYKLLQQVGEGGMGVVYMAEQIKPIERRVALKIIKPGMDTRQVIARFEAERQALAMMDHPNIARALDAGVTDTGRPYFVMELVKGKPITKYCDEHHLTPRERLELFVPVCQAIQHAHQKGIIHRDIKPTNVLVADYDDRPVPKIIDFGVAKAINHRLTEKTMFTELGQVLGTFEYMSPEQAKLNQWDVDTRTDIYSLGVLLYELLSGDTPFDRQRLRSAAIDELLRIIREEDPPRPSTRLSTSQALPTIAANRRTEPRKLGTVIHGELDWIVMKAMEKDRTRRYETASKFAEDVQHYLDDETVSACPPSMVYRLRKVIRKNWVGIATASVVAASLVVGTGVSVWQANVASRNAKAAEAAELQAQQRLEEVEKANDLMASIFETVNISSRDVELEAKSVEETLADRLSIALEDFENTTFRDPLIVAQMQHRLGSTFHTLRKYKRGLEFSQKAFDARKKLLTLHNYDTLDSLELLAWGYFCTQRPHKAADLFEQLLNTQSEWLGERTPETCETRSSLIFILTNTEGEEVKASELIKQHQLISVDVLGIEDPISIEATSQLAQLYFDSDEHERSIAFLKESLGKVDGSNRHAIMKFNKILGDFHLWDRRPEEALSYYRKARELSTELLQPDDPSLNEIAIDLGNALEALGKVDEALTIKEPALKALVDHYGPNSAGPRWQMLSVATAYLNSGRIDEAIDLRERVYYLYLTRYGKENSRIKSLANTLAEAYSAAGRWDDVFELEKQVDGQMITDSLVWLRGASYYAEKQDWESFDDVCHMMWERFKSSNDPQDAERTCRVCLLREGVVEPTNLPREVLIDSLKDPDLEERMEPWNFAARALLAYREKDFEIALQCAQESEARSDKLLKHLPADLVSSLNLSVIALAAHELQQSETANEALDQATQLFERHTQNGQFDLPIDLPLAHIVYQEAKSKIQGESP